MTQQLLNQYDELVGNICEDLAEFFDEAIANHEEGDCILCKTEEYMDSNKTNLMARLLKVSSQNPELVFYLLSQLSAQFASYQVMSDKLMESFLELHPPENN